MNRSSLGLAPLLSILLAVGIAGAACTVSSPAAPIAIPTPAIPTPTADKAVVFGTVFDYTTKKPFSDVVVYLGPIIATGGEGGMMVASLEATTAPRATSDASGTFFFTGIASGMFALATVTPSGHVFLVRPNGGEITLTTKANVTVDLGTVYFDLSRWR
jgi:hypothetical protein